MKLFDKVPVALALAALAAFPATAQPVLPSPPAQSLPPGATLQNVTTKGITMSVFGIQVPVDYTPDGKFTGRPPGEPVVGTWRIERGDTLCTRVPGDAEVCAVYPDGKASGDTFQVPGAMGPQAGVVTVRIN